MSHTPNSTSDHEAIATRAYHIWETEGRPDGRAEDHWRQAEEEIGAARRPVEEASAPPESSTQSRDVEISNTERALPPNERHRIRQARHRREGDVQTNSEAEYSAPLVEHFMVALDRAHLRIYRTDDPPEGRGEAPRLAEAMDLPLGREKYTALEADQAGRFAAPRGGPSGGSIDERLPMEQEHDRRLADQLATRLEAFLQQHPQATWDFAAGPALHHVVLENLSPAARQRLDVAVTKDLVNQSARQWRKHFRPARQS